MCNILKIFIATAITLSYTIRAAKVKSPPAITSMPDIDESYEKTSVLPTGYLYKLHLAHLPLDLTQEQFSIELVDQNLIRLSIPKSEHDWFFRLHKPITYTPSLEATRGTVDPGGLSWDLRFFIPNTV